MSYYKPILYFLFIFLLVIPNSCKDKHTEHLPSNLILNNGKKWKLDDPSRANFTAIKLEIEKAGAAKKYDSLFYNLELQTNKMISECRMSGPDHEMLHSWLEGFLASSKKLRSADNKIQEEAFLELKESVEIFPQYFE